MDITISAISHLDNMSNTEHLIENAIVCLEEKKSYEDFIDTDVNKRMFKLVKSPPEEIWDMAIYVYYTYRESIVWKTEDELVKRYGYLVP